TVTYPTVFRSQQDDLHQIDSEDNIAAGADAFEGGDHAALAVEIGAHGVGDADASDHKSRQSHQCEELSETPDVALQARRSVEARTHAPASLRKVGPRLLDQCLQALRARVLWKAHRIGPAHQTPG